MPPGVYPRTKVPPAVRFWRKVQVTEGCWLWQGARNGKYGAFGVDFKDVRPAHRYVYTLVRGEIPAGLTIDHLCRNTLCVNPAHLEAVTLAENIRRGQSPTIVIWRSGTCARGHERTEENTYVSPAGKRYCVPCEKSRRPRYKERAAAAARLRRAQRKGLAAAAS